MLGPGRGRTHTARRAEQRETRRDPCEHGGDGEREALRAERYPSGRFLEESGDTLQNAPEDPRDPKDDAQRPIGDAEAHHDEGVGDSERGGVKVLHRMGRTDDTELAAVIWTPFVSRPL